MEKNQPSEVVVLTQQGLQGAAARSLANANHFEAEDVLVDSGGVDRVFFLAEDDDLELRVRRHLGSGARRLRPRTTLPTIGRSGPSLDRDYRIAIALVRTVWDITMLETVRGLRERADIVVVWIFEMWPSGAIHRLETLPFHLVDLVFVGTSSEAAAQLDRMIAPPVHFMAAGIDIETFGIQAQRATNERSIDLLNIGRRDTDFHERFLEQAIKRDLTYVFDTTTGARLANHREHRWLLAQNYRRSKVAMTSAAKFDIPGPDRALRAVPNRLFEAMAAGTLMVGKPAPSLDHQIAQAGGVVVEELPDDTADAVGEVERIIAEDDGDRRRELASMARHHHDWSARWLDLFRRANTTPPAGLLGRHGRLTSSSPLG